VSEKRNLAAIIRDFQRKSQALARCKVCGGLRFGVSIGSDNAHMTEFTTASCTCGSTRPADAKETP
jgi:hypothetical protein